MSDENKDNIQQGEGNKPETPNADSVNPTGNEQRAAAKSEEPEVKKPEVKKPEVKKPEVKKPEVKKPKVKKPVAKKPEVKRPELPKPEPTTDESIAKSLMRKKGVKQVFKVGRYWFTDSQNAEQSERSQKLEMQIFD